MPKEKLITKGLIEHIGEKGSKIQDHYTGLKMILQKINQIEAVGHRVVHGAEKFRKPVLINHIVIRKIKQCCLLAPLHNPANLTGILASKKLLPGIKQVAVFDTAFHQTLPEYAYIYGLPYEYYGKLGIRKYGFHGTSHHYVACEAARILGKSLNKLKIITCHLGNGCSITAVNKGRSIDTSMGFTPLEGLIMGTRCGDIDPALITYLLRKLKLSIREIDDVLNKQSGLKGISGISNDMRILESKSISNKRARLAIDIFVYRIRKYIGAYIAIMGGCDALIFTAGIGEHQKGIREKICKGLFSYLKKKPKVLVIPTDEELMIARQTYRLVKGEL
jgi:acetate kinase